MEENGKEMKNSFSYSYLLKQKIAMMLNCMRVQNATL